MEYGSHNGKRRLFSMITLHVEFKASTPLDTGQFGYLDTFGSCVYSILFNNISIINLTVKLWLHFREILQ